MALEQRVALSSGETLVVKAMEITQIPSAHIVKNDFPPEANIDNEYRRGFGNLLGEIHRGAKARGSGELVLELLWLTQPVSSQPYQANIRMFFVFRGVAAREQEAEQLVDGAMASAAAALKLHKFGFAPADMDAVCQNSPVFSEKRVYTISRDHREERLENPMLPACFSYDVFAGFAGDLRILTNCLIECPDCAVSLCLSPTVFAPEEAAAIGQTNQVLSTLSRGVAAQGVGLVSFTMAGKAAATYQYYQDNQSAALFSYNILAYGAAGSIEKVVSRLQGFLSYDPGHTTALKQTVYELPIQGNYYALPWLAGERILQAESADIAQRYANRYHMFSRLPGVVTAEEASGFFRLPIGSQQIGAGLPVNESESASKTFANDLINAGDIVLGTLKASGKDQIGIQLRDLTKHMLIAGMPGSGKTTFSVGLLDRLWKEHHIPFLVIEPAKNEYRALIQSIPELQIFTPGKNFISPFVFNPFVPPKNVKLETYKSTLKTAFSAAVSMPSPLDNIFEEAINNCYSDFRWLDTYTSDDGGRIFNVADFIQCFQRTFDQIGYTGDARNVGRAGVVRLSSIANLFDNYYSIPIEDILSKPTVIELAAIENSDQKALLIALLLLSILAYVNANYIGDGTLKNVILLEEAHVLLDASTNIGVGEANPSAVAQSLVKRMLAEVRSYGIGMMIADQSPRKVTSDVVALTDMKMIFRLVEGEDKRIVSDSMNMEEAQEKRLSRLKPGEAFLFFNRLETPEELVTPDYRQDNRISITLSDQGVRAALTYWNERQALLRPYPECAHVHCCENACDYERRALAKEVARRIFLQNFHPTDDNFEPVEKTIKQIVALVKEQLNREPFSPELLLCVKCHLWRRIRYGTRIPVRDVQIINSLSK